MLFRSLIASLRCVMWLLYADAKLIKPVTLRQLLNSRARILGGRNDIETRYDAIVDFTDLYFRHTPNTSAVQASTAHQDRQESGIRIELTSLSNADAIHKAQGSISEGFYPSD